MILGELVKELEDILKVHPEAKDATIWVQNDDVRFRVSYVRLSKKTKVPRVYLED
jgi:hypothetical protein